MLRPCRARPAKNHLLNLRTTTRAISPNIIQRINLSDLSKGESLPFAFDLSEIEIESLFSITTVSLLITFLDIALSLRLRSETRSRSVTIQTLTVSPFSLRSTVTVVLSTTLSRASSNALWNTESLTSDDILFISLLSVTLLLLTQPLSDRTIPTISTVINTLNRIPQLIYFLTQFHHLNLNRS